jgi:hypothetical protein
LILKGDLEMNKYNNKGIIKRGFLYVLTIVILSMFTSCSRKDQLISDDTTYAEVTEVPEYTVKPSDIPISNIPSNEVTAENPDKSKLFGNLMSNIANEGWAAESNGWIYCDYALGLYKMKEDGAQIKLSDNSPRNINIWDGWVYYANDYPGKGEIYRTSEDGTKTEKLNNELVYSLIINNDWIYYVTVKYPDDNVEYKIKKIALDGSKETELVSETVKSNLRVTTNQLYLYNGWIYYISMKDSNRFYKIDVDGTNRIKVSNEIISKEYSMNSFIIENDWIYFTQLEGDYHCRLYRMKIDGTSKEMVIDSSIHNFNISDNYIFYTDASEYQYPLYKVKIDGTEKTKLTDIGVADINIIGNYIYCRDEKGSSYFLLDMEGNFKFDNKMRPTPDY